MNNETNEYKIKVRSISHPKASKINQMKGYVNCTILLNLETGFQDFIIENISFYYTMSSDYYFHKMLD